MRERFLQVMERAKTLEDAFLFVREVFQQYAFGAQKAIYVSGVIGSYGVVVENRGRMAMRVEALKAILGPTVFAPTCIFSDSLYQKLKVCGYRHADWMAFWTHVLCTGYVGTMVMTPGWEYSRGADMEYSIARNMGMSIYYYDDENLLRLE